MSNASLPAATMPPATQLQQLLSGYMVTQALAVLAKLDVAEQLAAGPVAASELATRVGANADALARILRATASVGVFAEVSPGVFGLTPTASLLRESTKPSFRHLAILFGSTLYRAWGHAQHSVMTGEPAFPEVFGKKHFDHLGQDPEALATFSKAMAGAARGRLDLLELVDWAASKQVVDVGGGDGTLLVGLLGKHVHLEGFVFDLPELEPRAAQIIAAAGLDARLGFEGGSFLTTPPPAADTYVLAKVLHNWSDEDAGGVLAHIRSVAKPGARLVILDEVIRDDNAPQQGKLLDLQMLVILGGRERTQKEFAALLERHGFHLTRAIDDPRGGVVMATMV